MARILIIDDDPDIRKLLNTHFSTNGHKVFLAEDGAHGIGLAVSARPDVVILDMQMPVLDGQSTLRVLQSTPQMAGIPVLVLSGLQCATTRDAMVNAGCVDYLTKPFDLDHLERVVIGAVDEGTVVTPFPAESSTLV